MNKCKKLSKKAAFIKNILFIISWIIGSISILTFLIHCWETRDVQQPWLLISKIGLLISISLSLPYIWSLNLQRYRLLGNAIVLIICISLLSSIFFKDPFKI